MSLIANVGTDSLWLLVRRMADPVMNKVKTAVDRTIAEDAADPALAPIDRSNSHWEEDAERWDGMS